MEFAVYDPYCGPAPVPAELIGRWNFDPLLLTALALGALLWMAYGRRDQPGKIAFSGSYVLIFIAFISPLCALSSALFSARVAHHLILIGGIAPLLAIALPWRRGPILPLSALTILHTAFVWIWHAPDPYAMALDSHAIYWLMQLTLGGSAYLLWREVFSPFTRKSHSDGAACNRHADGLSRCPPCLFATGSVRTALCDDRGIWADGARGSAIGRAFDVGAGGAALYRRWTISACRYDQS